MEHGKPARGITPERAQEILKQKGYYVSLDKAVMTLVLDFMYKMAESELKNFQKDK